MKVNHTVAITGAVERYVVKFFIGLVFCYKFSLRWSVILQPSKRQGVELVSNRKGNNHGNLNKSRCTGVRLRRSVPARSNPNKGGQCVVLDQSVIIPTEEVQWLHG